MGSRIYLDTCCVHRPFDDQTDARVYLETEAVLAVVQTCIRGLHMWIGSDVLRYETGMVRAPHISEGDKLLLEAVREWLPTSDAIQRRALEIKRIGIRPLDALHVATAEAGSVDVFLTVDNQLLRAAARRQTDLMVRILNPVTWAREEGIR